jgi:hypothetical protein
MQVKLAQSHFASYLACGIQVQDEKCQEFFLSENYIPTLKSFFSVVL